MKILLFLSLIFQINSSKIQFIFKKWENSWENLRTYKCTLDTYSKKGKKEEWQLLLYKFIKPKWIYVYVLKGRDEKSEALYNPFKNKVKVRKKKGLISFVKLTLSPYNKMLCSIRGEYLIESDFGSVLEEWKSYKEIYLIEDGKDFWKLKAILQKPKVKGDKYSYIWINKKNFLPFKIEVYNENGEKVHYSIWKNIQIDIPMKPKDLEF
ncbi:hypothetical protein DRN73_09050 [Candidatus Pacearchaeota archaeon]|nr:MAG: hypothetical protein DRN73_09050 [Candidatus Pacearchaeota archaeon]